MSCDMVMSSHALIAISIFVVSLLFERVKNEDRRIGFGATGEKKGTKEIEDKSGYKSDGREIDSTCN
jgi:hypothetical protein